MVTFFGILVVPLGIVSIGLIILQPVVVGAWCTLSGGCPVDAYHDRSYAGRGGGDGPVLMLARREGQSLWLGGTLRATGSEAVPVRADVISTGAMFRSVALPWNLVAVAALGLWLMASPGIFGTTDGVAHSDQIVGALVITAAIMALSDVGRSVRFVNVLGAWFVAAAWLLGGARSQRSGIMWPPASRHSAELASWSSQGALR